MKPGEVVMVDRGRITQDPPGKIRTGSYPSYKWVDCPACGGEGCSDCGKRHRSTGITYTWLACDACGGISLIKGLAPDQTGIVVDEEYRQNHGRPCRMTPHCIGRHLVAKEPS